MATYAYNQNSNPIVRTVAGGIAGTYTITTTYTHNLAGLIQSLTNRHGTTTLSSYTYAYFLDGNTHRVTETLSSGHNNSQGSGQDNGQGSGQGNSQGNGQGSITRVTTYTFDLARRLIKETAEVTVQPATQPATQGLGRTFLLGRSRCLGCGRIGSP